MRYKDESSLKLLGWDGSSSSFAFSLPWQRDKQARGAPSDSTDGDGKRRKIEVRSLQDSTVLYS